MKTELAIKTVTSGGGRHLKVLTDNITIKLSGKDTGGAFSLIENTNSPGDGIPTHTHRREDETFFIIEGEVEVQVGDETFIARKGDTAFLPRGIPHAWRIVGERVARMLVTATPAGLDDFFVEASQLPADPSPDYPRFFEIAARYGIEFAAQNNNAEQVSETLHSKKQSV